MEQLDKIRAQFRVKYRMLCDYHKNISGTESSIAVSVIKRQFDKFYGEFVACFESLVANNVEDLDKYTIQFSEVNSHLCSIENQLEGQVPQRSSQSSATVAEAGISAKLPFIQLPKYSGKVSEWIAFHDLFVSLVHNRQSLPDAEKHYYLRSSLDGEPLSLIKHLPVDAANYEVAFKLLKDRYHNVRLLADSYLEIITKLPTLSSHLDTRLRTDLFNPLMEATQALDKLGLPVESWSYLLLHIVLQKLPAKIRNLFEERYGTVTTQLPTFKQLKELLDEQCRLQLRSSPEPEERKSPVERQYQTSRQRGRVQQHRQLASTGILSSCSYCSQSGHTLYKCHQFLKMSPSARKGWARQSNHCFKCLRKHFSRECTQSNWCKHCGASHHNSLICTTERTKDSSRIRTPPGTGRPKSPVVIANHASGVQSTQYTSRSTEELSSPNYVSSRNVGQRYQQAQEQYESLRYGRQGSPCQDISHIQIQDVNNYSVMD